MSRWIKFDNLTFNLAHTTSVATCIVTDKETEEKTHKLNVEMTNGTSWGLYNGRKGVAEKLCELVGSKLEDTNWRGVLDLTADAKCIITEPVDEES